MRGFRKVWTRYCRPKGTFRGTRFRLEPKAIVAACCVSTCVSPRPTAKAMAAMTNPATLAQIPHQNSESRFTGGLPGERMVPNVGMVAGSPGMKYGMVGGSPLRSLWT